MIINNYKFRKSLEDRLEWSPITRRAWKTANA